MSATELKRKYLSTDTAFELNKLADCFFVPLM
jgi:hypothetical protein